MSRVIACPKCQKRYQLAQDPAGKPMKCPACQATFTVDPQSAASSQAPQLTSEQRQALLRKQQAEKTEHARLGIGGKLASQPKLLPDAPSGAPQADPLSNHVVDDPGFAHVDLEAIRRRQEEKELEKYRNPFHAQKRELTPAEKKKQKQMPAGKLLFGFKGRIPRRVFWGAAIGMGVLFNMIVWCPMFLIEDPATAATVFLVLNLAIALPAFWIGVALQVKRWHDRDKSGWWWFIGLVPVIGGIWVFVECGCLRGTVGKNRFGPDPT